MTTSENLHDLILREIKSNYLIVDDLFNVHFTNIPPKHQNLSDLWINEHKLIPPELKKVVKQALSTESQMVFVQDWTETETIRFVVKRLNKQFAMIEFYPDKSTVDSDSKDRQIQELSAELGIYKGNIEEMQNELHIASSELMRTSRELQSLNEEVYQINAELNDRINELNQANEKSNKLINNASLCMIVLDQEHHISKGSQITDQLFRNSHEDKAIYELEKNFDFPEFKNFVRGGVNSGASNIKRIQANSGLSYEVRRIALDDYLVLLFIDITKEIENPEITKIIYENKNDYVAVFDREIRVKISNEYTFSPMTAAVLKFDDLIKRWGEDFYEHVKEMFQVGTARRQRIQIPKECGEMRTFECFIKRIDQSDQQLGVLIAKDITESV